jgi:hypothetical protein
LGYFFTILGSSRKFGTSKDQIPKEERDSQGEGEGRWVFSHHQELDFHHLDEGRKFSPHHLGMDYYVNFLGRLGSNGFQQK